MYSDLLKHFTWNISANHIVATNLFMTVTPDFFKLFHNFKSVIFHLSYIPVKNLVKWCHHASTSALCPLQSLAFS